MSNHQLLGRSRGRSKYSAPIRRALQVKNDVEAMLIIHDNEGRSLARQAWDLTPNNKAERIRTCRAMVIHA